MAAEPGDHAEVERRVLVFHNDVEAATAAAEEVAVALDMRWGAIAFRVVDGKVRTIEVLHRLRRGDAQEADVGTDEGSLLR
jgi:hypothetical protein